jgi:gamma-polyglutamate biosynthesis protein CapA
MTQPKSLVENRPLKILLILAVLFLVSFVLLMTFTVINKETIVYKDEVPQIDVTAPLITDAVASTPLPVEHIPPQPSTISFTGDIMLGRHVEYLMDQFGNDYPISKLPVDLFASSSYVVVNFESAMREPHLKTPNNGMVFSTAKDKLSLLSKLGVTHASLANNHTLDYGLNGYLNAKNELSDIAIAPFGNPASLATSTVAYIKLGEQTIALIAINAVFVDPLPSEVGKLLVIVNEQSDKQVIVIHWGEEYELVHSARQRALAEVLIENGADLIVGHHPHVTQDIELIDGVPVLYSLGNFIFDQYFSTEVQRGYIADVTFSTTGSSTIALRPYTRHDRAQNRLMTEAEASEFLDLLAKRSDTILFEQIKAKNITF